MALYNITFSPTGGTKKVSDILAMGIAGDFKDIELCAPDSNLEFVSLDKEDICLISVPSFGGRVPEIALKRLSKIRSNGAKVIIVCVYGNRAYEDTLIELKNTLELAGFKCFAAVAAIAEHSIAREIAQDRPDKDDKGILTDFANKIKNKIFSSSFELSSKIPGNNTYKDRSKSKSVPETSDNCNLCGACAKLCPVGAIDFKNPKLTCSETCVSCMKCISVCPQKAKKLNDETLKAISDRLGKLCSERKENELYL